MGLLTREVILSADDIGFKIVPVPEWGGDVRLKTLRGDQIDAYQQSRLKKDGGVDIKRSKAQLVAMASVDEKGQRIFTPEDVERLAQKSNIALERVAKVVADMSGLKPESLDAAGEGFGPDPSAPSTTASPSPSEA